MNKQVWHISICYTKFVSDNCIIENILAHYSTSSPHTPLSSLLYYLYSDTDIDQQSCDGLIYRSDSSYEYPQ